MTSFNRALCFTDLHLNRRSDSEQNNQDCEAFVDWAITQYHEQNCDAVIFMGDWMHNRVHVRWDSLMYSERITAKLSALGCPVYFIVGNHDMWFNHSREIHVHKTTRLHLAPNFHIIDELTQIDDCLFCPYLIGAEYNSVAQTKAKYVFGHFSLPGFLVNENYLMPDGDGLKSEFFDGPTYVFSGHFHKRQWKTNSNGTHVIYIGNCFPHDWNDIGDRDRGCMIFDRTQEPKFINWTEAPTFDRIDLSEMIKLIEADTFPAPFNSRSTIHITNDIQLDDEAGLTHLRDFLGQQGFRAVKIEPPEAPEEIAEHAPIPAPRENITDYFRVGLNQVDTEGSKYQLPLLTSLFDKAMESYDNG